MLPLFPIIRGSGLYVNFFKAVEHERLVYLKQCVYSEGCVSSPLTSYWCKSGGVCPHAGYPSIQVQRNGKAGRSTIFLKKLTRHTPLKPFRVVATCPNRGRKVSQDLE